GSTSEEYVADALLDFADFYLLTRQWKGSLRQMRHAEPVFEGTPRFEFMRIRALTSLLLADSADVLVGSLAGRHKTELPWLLGFIRHFIDRGAADSARAYLDLALEVAEADFGVLLAHVELAQLGGDSLEYRRALEDLVEAHPRDLRSLRLLAAYHNAGGRPALALDLADRMIEYYPGNLSSYQFAARVATREDGSAAGLRYLRLAAKNNPELPAIYHMLSVSFLRDGLSDSVENYVNRSLELDPDYIPSRLSRGLFLESQGKTDSAIAIYRGVIERDPFSAEAFNNLAWVMASNDIDPAAAANHAREAISLSGGVKANMHGTLGWAYFKQKRYKFANVAYLRAIQMDPGDPFKRYLIGINLESLGKNDEALRELRTALDLGIQGTYRQLTEQAVARLGG
ncbi:MAG: tetratricopeptide repeat protein, partial [Candidatus Zixiibacteriota bacterium]